MVAAAVIAAGSLAASASAASAGSASASRASSTAGRSAVAITALPSAHAVRAASSKRKLPVAEGCLKFAGLGHITFAHGRWQGTAGELSLKYVKYSVFVKGPYRSAGAAAAARRSIGRTYLAFRGGKYVTYIMRSSYLTMSASLAAACLSSNGHGYSF
jgi:hypothetical protein